MALFSVITRKEQQKEYSSTNMQKQIYDSRQNYWTVRTWGSKGVYILWIYKGIPLKKEYTHRWKKFD